MSRFELNSLQNSGEAAEYLHQQKDLSHINQAKYSELVSAVAILTAERRWMVSADVQSQRVDRQLRGGHPPHPAGVVPNRLPVVALEMDVEDWSPHG